MSENILEIVNLNKSYIQAGNEIKILDNFNLSLAKGEFLAVIGSSGSGKTTLLQIAGLLDKPTSGNVIYPGNVDSSKLSEMEKQKLRLNFLGFIYQYHHLLKDFNARENIAIPALIAGKNFNEYLEKSDEILKRLGMFERRFNYPNQLSGGEQQRVAIARALTNSPSIILADEPTGNLDPKTAMIVFNLFKEIIKEKGCSAIMVTHNHEIASKADRILSL